MKLSMRVKIVTALLLPLIFYQIGFVLRYIDFGPQAMGASSEGDEVASLLSGKLPNGDKLNHPNGPAEVIAMNRLQAGRNKEVFDTSSQMQTKMRREVKRNSTLALILPPGLLDGYHNQVMRFIAFVAQARRRGLTQLFRPSLLWSTQLHSIENEVHGCPIPMEWVFDIDFWNSFSHNLPTIVPDLPESDCWADMVETSQTSAYWPSNWTLLNHLEREALSRGAFRDLVNTTVGFITGNVARRGLRQLDILPVVAHCREPQAYGGGTGSAQTGHLWYDFVGFLSNPSANGSVAPYQVDKWVLMALQPAPRWRNVAEQCVQSNTKDNGNYLAVHARVELDMLAHTHCSQHMEQNLTKILETVENLSQNISAPLNSTFLAISRYGLEIKNWMYEQFKTTADDNLRTYYRVTGYNQTQRPDSGIGSDDFPVFQCGEPALSKFYNENPEVPDHGYLLHSVLDFYVAVNAFAFVGPAWGSTFTRDVWITRYHLGKGEHNYQYTKEGWGKVGKDGLPNMHKFC